MAADQNRALGPELESWAMSVNDELGIRPHNAELVVEDGVVSIIPEVKGTVVDVPALHDILMKSISKLEAPTSYLPLVDFQPKTFATDLEPTRQQIEAALAEPVTLEYGSTTWTVEPAEFGEFISVSIDPERSGQESVNLEIDNRGFARWLDELIGPTVNEDPKNAKVAWDGSKLKTTVAGVDGVRLLPSSLAETASDAFFTDHRAIEVPIQVLEPEVNGDNLDQLGITTKLAAGSSNFDGSEESRAINIQVGVDLLNGTLVRPGGEFSFNHAVGIITTEAGFVESQLSTVSALAVTSAAGFARYRLQCFARRFTQACLFRNGGTIVTGSDSMSWTAGRLESMHRSCSLRRSVRRRRPQIHQPNR